MNNFYDKDEVLKSAEGMWTSILSQLGGLDSKYLNHNKHCDCPLGCIGGSSNQPGGKDRYRWINKPDGHSICNVCGSRDGFNLYLDFTGHSFVDAMSDIGNYLNMIPTERRELIKRETYVRSFFPSYYNFDFDLFEDFKQMSEVKLSPWQRVNGLGLLDILAYGENALIPLLDTNQNACDFVMIDVNNNWQTTGGNRCVPSGFYSTFGDRVGKRTYICVEPANSAHASVYMGCQVVCCYEVENILPVMSALDKKNRVDISTSEGREKAIENMQRDECEMEFAVIVAGMDDVEEADTLRLNQLTYNAQTRTVARTVYKPFEISDKRKENGK